MKFIKHTNDIIYFDANAAERSALLLFIEASIRDFDTNTIDISNFGTSKKTLEDMHRVISNQLGNKKLVKMSNYLFDQMGLVAGAWISCGFENVLCEDQNTLEADKDTAYAVRGMFNECFKYTLKILADEDPIQLEVGRPVLDMAIRITSYINTNFDESDFFTIGNTSHNAVNQFLELLKEGQGGMKLEQDNISLKIYQYDMLESVLWYGSNFGDDIPELEPHHDQIWDIYHGCFP